MRRVLGTVLCVVAAGRLAAQEPAPAGLWGEVSILFARQAVADQQELAGSWWGAGLEGTWGHLSLGVRGYTGTAGSGVDQRRMSLGDARVRVRVRPWLALGLEGDALRSAEPGDTSLWRMAGPTAAVTAGLGVSGLTASAEGTYFAVTGVSGLDPLAHSARLEVGMEYAPGALPVGLRLAFRRQMFEFSDARAAESLGGVTLSVRARLFGH
ncbi:MAG TPA: hypothetical protein VFK78_02125 [Gemmatimonadales bacterium]|nr:hypothetical protein [Gemmatimonadales bacterium]